MGGEYNTNTKHYKLYKMLFSKAELRRQYIDAYM
jgi:hypothetical protein